MTTLFYIIIGTMALFAAVVLSKLAAQTRALQQDIDFDWVVELETPSVLPFADFLNEDAPLRIRWDQRRQARRHLAHLRSDFRKITFLLKRLIVFSEYDRADLSRLVFRHSAVFYASLMMIEVTLWLHVLGLRTVRLRNMVSISLALLRSVRDLAIALTSSFFLQRMTANEEA